MSNMSRMATAEYIGIKRRAYAEAGSAKRRHLLTKAAKRRVTPGLPLSSPTQDKERSGQYLTNQNPSLFLKRVFLFDKQGL